MTDYDDYDDYDDEDEDPATAPRLTATRMKNR